MNTESADEVIRAVHADSAELERLSAANMSRIQALAREGAQVDPVSMLNLRIEVLAQMVLDAGRLLEYRLSVQRQLAESLRQLAGEVRKASIAAAAQVTPQQVRQMAKATGLLGPDGKPLHG